MTTSHMTALKLSTLLAATIAVTSAEAACRASDRPPAPTQVKVLATSDTSIYVQWAARRNDFVDLVVKQKSNNRVIFNVAGGLRGQWERHFPGLVPDQEYEVTIRSRTQGGTEGCVSVPPVVMTTRTATRANANVCRTYVRRVAEQVKAMAQKKCPTSGSRWSRDQNMHSLWCLNERASGRTTDVSEMKARDEAIAACTGPAPAPSPGANPGSFQDMLNAHNERRKLHCAPPLRWNAQLAAAAQQHADKCTNQHDTTQPNGENLAFFTRTANGRPVLPAATDPQAFENAWYCEIKNYNFDRPELVGGFTQNCNPPVNGHFTQVVWRATTELGCGRATCTINGQQGTYWVCRYSVRGNDRGTLAQNVQRATCR
jgi:uncharacterized protein YkwD